MHLLLKIFVEFRIYACQYFSTLTVSFHRCLALWTSRLLVFFISRLKLRALFFHLFLRFLSVTLFSVFKKLYVPSYVFVFVCVTVLLCFVYILLMVRIPKYTPVPAHIPEHVAYFISSVLNILVL